MFKTGLKVQEYIDNNHPKIGIIAPTLDSVPSKQGNAIYCLIEDIAKYSTHGVVVFSIFKDDMPTSAIQDRIIYHSSPPKKRIHHRILGNGLCKRLYGVSRTEDFSVVSDIVKFAESIRLECLMIEDSSSLLIGALKSPKSNLKFILHQHITALLGIKTQHWTAIQNRINEVVFVSNNSLDVVEKKFGKFKIRTNVIYNGVNENHFDTVQGTKTLKGEKVIELLFVGRIHPVKGVLELVKSMLLLPEYVNLTIVGDLKPVFGYDEVYIKAIIETIKKSEGRIAIAGVISQSNIERYYQKADLVIVPSIGNEGLPKVITEAVMMERAILASDRGGNKEVIEDGVNGYIIPDPIEEISISKTIMKGIENIDVLRQGAVKKKKKFSEIFSAKYMSRQFDILFSRVLES